MNRARRTLAPCQSSWATNKFSLVEDCASSETLGLPGVFYIEEIDNKRIRYETHRPGLYPGSLPSSRHGILNVTPDSFSDGGTHNTLVEAVKHANLMINAGATIVDVGGESTRPGALDVSVEEELDRVIPVVEAIAQRFEVWISVDTSKPEVIRESARAGAHIINDIRSLSEPGRWRRRPKPGFPFR